MEQPTDFHQFVLTTCVPSHVKTARKGVNDWTKVSNTTFVSPSSGLVHECHPELCSAWVIRFVDGVRVCAISGYLLKMGDSVSPRKRDMDDSSPGKRHQDKAIQGSSAYLEEKFLTSNDDAMQIETGYSHHFPRLNQYPYN